MPIYYNPRLEAQKDYEATKKVNVKILETREARSINRPDIETYYLGQVYEVPLFLAKAFLEVGAAIYTKQRAYDTPYRRNPIHSSAQTWTLF